MMEKLFVRNKLEDGEHKKRFLSQLRPKSRKLCVMKDHANIKTLLNATL